MRNSFLAGAGVILLGGSAALVWYPSPEINRATRGSEHPLAEAIVDGAEAQGAPRLEATDFDGVTGKGVQGRVGGRAVALGNAAMMREMGLDTAQAEANADTLRAEGKTAMFVALDGALVGIVAVADPIKDSTAQAIRELHAQGLRVIMATGDNERTAQAVAGKLGIDEVRAGILPEAKKDLIDQLRREGHKIAMAGGKRRARTGRSRCRHRHGHRGRCCDGKRRHHPVGRRLDGHRAGGAGNQGGLALKHFNVGAFKRLEVLLPPLPEQHKIAEILRTWDVTLEKLTALRAAKERRLDGLAATLIFHEQAEYAHLREFLSEVSARNRDQQIARMLSVTNSAGFILAEDQFAHRVASADLSNYKIVRRGQYAYNPSRINVGSIARLDAWDNGVLSPMYVVFEVLDGLDSDFFGHWLRSAEARQRIALTAQGSVRETVSFGDLGSILVPVPSIERQRSISRALNAARQEMVLIDAQIEALTRQKRGLMEKLLTGRLRVPQAEAAS